MRRYLNKTKENKALPTEKGGKKKRGEKKKKETISLFFAMKFPYQEINVRDLAATVFVLSIIDRING